MKTSISNYLKLSTGKEMVSQGIWIGIAVGVFFAGLGIGYALLQSTVPTTPMMMTSQQMQQMMNNPQAMNTWMTTMMHNPQQMNQWMMQNPQMMNQWMGNIMNDPQLRDHMYSQMMQNNQFMQGMMTNQQFQNQWMGPWMMQNNSTWSGMMGGPMMGQGVQSMQATVDSNLARFDQLDFEAFTNKDWELFNDIHDPDVLVVWPDGRQTRGIEQHDKDIALLYDYAPDVRILVHPIKFGSGEWTAVTGIMEGTFTGPMILADGTTIEPTGKAFKVPMTTIAHWKDGRIIEENLFWDNAELMRQMGIAS